MGCHSKVLFVMLEIPKEGRQSAAWRRGADKTPPQGGVIHVDGNMLLFIRRTCRTRAAVLRQDFPVVWDLSRLTTKMSMHICYLYHASCGANHFRGIIPCSIPLLKFHAKAAATHSPHYLNIPPSCARAFEGRHFRVAKSN